jgi:hypothetical protein
MLHIRLSHISGDRDALDECAAYIQGDGRMVIQSQPGSLGLALEAGHVPAGMLLGSLWATATAAEAAEETESSVRGELASWAQGPVAVRDYQVLIFEQEAQLRRGQAIRLTRLEAKPSFVDDVVEAVGDTAVPMLAGTPGFRAAMLFADPDSGQLISQTVWGDAHSRSTGPDVGAVIRAEVLADAALEVSAVEDYDLVFSSLRVP